MILFFNHHTIPAPAGVVISITSDMIDTALRTFLRTLVPADVEVVRAQDNRVPMPGGPNFVIFTPKRRTPLSTTSLTWDKVDPLAEVLGRRQSVEVAYQLDLYGPLAGDYAQIIATMTRDYYGAAGFDPSLPIQPLYATEGRQMPLVAGEHQYENRWTQDFVMQISPTVSTRGEFASIVAITLKPIGG